MNPYVRRRLARLATVVIITALLNCTSHTLLPSPKDKYESDPCGDPRMEIGGEGHMVIGKAIEVIDGQTFIMSSDPGDRLRVRLAGIEAPPVEEPLGRDAKAFLEKELAEKIITVFVNEENRPTFPRAVITGAVYLGTDTSVQLELIRVGFVRYVQSAPYTMSFYLECQCERAEKEAHAAKRGIWASSKKRLKK